VEKLLPHLPDLAESVNVIVKLHGFSWSQRRYRHQSEAAQQVAKEGVCLMPREDYNIVPLYAAADLLISDISSTLFEYLALNRPILQTTFTTPRLKHRIFKSRLRRRLDLGRSAEIDFTHRLDRPEDVSTVVREVLEKRNEMSPQRQAAAERFLYRTDGRASARLVDAIEERLPK
jgi:CDP-glycerol glycerophosphotransferase (TagB/SpsB family)